MNPLGQDLFSLLPTHGSSRVSSGNCTGWPFWLFLLHFTMDLKNIQKVAEADAQQWKEDCIYEVFMYFFIFINI